MQAVAYLEIWKGGGQKYLTTFFVTQTNLQKLPSKKFDDLVFSNFSHFFLFSQIVTDWRQLPDGV
jgi:hypothetical protein